MLNKTLSASTAHLLATPRSKLQTVLQWCRAPSNRRLCGMASPATTSAIVGPWAALDPAPLKCSTTRLTCRSARSAWHMVHADEAADAMLAEHHSTRTV